MILHQLHKGLARAAGKGVALNPEVALVSASP